jgi:hypothetical protein
MAKAFAWDENTTAEVVAVYKATLSDLLKENEGSTDAVNSRQALTAAASAVGTSEASARIKLAKETVYVKVETKKAAAKPAAEGAAGGKRMNKADQQAELVASFADHGVTDLDMEIIEKLTGKAAAHLATKIRMITVGE